MFSTDFFFISATRFENLYGDISSFYPGTQLQGLHRCYGDRLLPLEVTVNIDEEEPWENFRPDDATCEIECATPIWSVRSSDEEQGARSSSTVDESQAEQITIIHSGQAPDFSEAVPATGESSNGSHMQSDNPMPSFNITVPLEPEHPQFTPESQQDAQEPVSMERYAI